MKNPTDKDLLEQIQKILNPTGPHTPHPNLTPVPGSEKEQHKPKEKKAGFADRIGGLLPEGSAIGKHLSDHANAYDLAGLGVLAAPSAVELAQESRKPKEERRGIGKHLAEIGGLGLIAAPVAASAMGFKHASPFFDELQKLGMVSDDEAARALQSLQDLEENKPSAKQTLGYMGIGAAATPIMHMAGNAIRGRPLLGDVDALKSLAGNARLMHMARDAGAQAFKGGVGGTVVSIGQQQLDRHHNMGKLREYVSQSDAEKTAGFLDSAKKLLLTDVGGPKGILQPAGQAAQNAAPKMKKPGDDFKAWQAKRMAKTGGAPPPLPAAALKPKANPMADALFAGMKASKANPMPSVIPKTAGAPMMPVPKMKGLAGSGTPAMPMPKPAMPKNNGMGMLG
jgi:hypothetical protein